MTLLLLLTSLSACKVESTTESSDSASKSASTQKDADTEIENFNATGFPIVNKTNNNSGRRTKESFD